MLNQVIIEGYVAKDPQFRTFETNEVCNFVLKHLDYKNTAHWIYISCNRGEITKHIKAQGIQKNSWVHVQGYMATRKSNESSNYHDITMVMANRVFLIDKVNDTYKQNSIDVAMERLAEIDMAEQVSPNLNKPVKVDYNNRFTGIGVQCESPVFETLPF